MLEKLLNEKLDKIKKSLVTGKAYASKLIIVEEKDTKKTNKDWKTVKMLKELISLKRYRIVNRLKMLKGLKN